MDERYERETIYIDVREKFTIKIYEREKEVIGKRENVLYEYYFMIYFYIF